MKTRFLKRALLAGHIFIVASAAFFILALNIFFPSSYGDEVFSASRHEGVEESLLFAVIKAESGFDETAVSNRGARGLMQLMPSTFIFALDFLPSKDYNFDIMEPSINIRTGATYLRYLTEKFNDKFWAIAAYNAGEGNVERWIFEGRKNIPFEETERYVKKVLFFKRIYEYKFN